MRDWGTSAETRGHVVQYQWELRDPSSVESMEMKRTKDDIILKNFVQSAPIILTVLKSSAKSLCRNDTQ